MSGSMRPTFFLIIDLTSRNFVLSAIDIGLKVIDRMMYEYNSDFYFEENLYIFLKNINIYLRRRFDRRMCSGVGVALPGAYNATVDRVTSVRLPEINNITIRESVSSVLNLPICLLEQDIKLAAMSNIAAIPNYHSKILSYLYIGENIDAAIIFHGQLLYGANSLAGRICALPTGSGVTVGKIVEQSQNQEDIADVLVFVLSTLCCIADPHEIVIECDRYKLSQGYLDMLADRLVNLPGFSSQTLPKLSQSQGNMRHAHRGLVLKMRDMWLDTLR